METPLDIVNGSGLAECGSSSLILERLEPSRPSNLLGIEEDTKAQCTVVTTHAIFKLLKGTKLVSIDTFDGCGCIGYTRLHSKQSVYACFLDDGRIQVYSTLRDSEHLLGNFDCLVPFYHNETSATTQSVPISTGIMTLLSFDRHTILSVIWTSFHKIPQCAIFWRVDATLLRIKLLKSCHSCKTLCISFAIVCKDVTDHKSYISFYHGFDPPQLSKKYLLDNNKASELVFSESSNDFVVCLTNQDTSLFYSSQKRLHWKNKGLGPVKLIPKINVTVESGKTRFLVAGQDGNIYETKLIKLEQKTSYLEWTRKKDNSSVIINHMQYTLATYFTMICSRFILATRNGTLLIHRFGDRRISICSFLQNDLLAETYTCGILGGTNGSDADFFVAAGMDCHRNGFLRMAAVGFDYRFSDAMSIIGELTDMSLFDFWVCSDCIKYESSGQLLSIPLSTGTTGSLPSVALPDLESLVYVTTSGKVIILEEDDVLATTEPRADTVTDILLTVSKLGTIKISNHEQPKNSIVILETKIELPYPYLTAISSYLSVQGLYYFAIAYRNCICIYENTKLLIEKTMETGLLLFDLLVGSSEQNEDDALYFITSSAEGCATLFKGIKSTPSMQIKSIDSTSFHLLELELYSGIVLLFNEKEHFLLDVNKEFYCRIDLGFQPLKIKRGPDGDFYAIDTNQRLIRLCKKFLNKFVKSLDGRAVVKKQRALNFKPTDMTQIPNTPYCIAVGRHDEHGIQVSIINSHSLRSVDHILLDYSFQHVKLAPFWSINTLSLGTKYFIVSSSELNHSNIAVIKIENAHLKVQQKLKLQFIVSSILIDHVQSQIFFFGDTYICFTFDIAHALSNKIILDKVGEGAPRLFETHITGAFCAKGKIYMVDPIGQLKKLVFNGSIAECINIVEPFLDKCEGILKVTTTSTQKQNICSTKSAKFCQLLNLDAVHPGTTYTAILDTMNSVYIFKEGKPYGKIHLDQDITNVVSVQQYDNLQFARTAKRVKYTAPLFIVTCRDGAIYLICCRDQQKE